MKRFTFASRDFREFRLKIIYTSQVEFKSAPPAETQLRIHLATPEAVQTFGVKVENVPLP
jgi:hypothetical protein